MIEGKAIARFGTGDILLTALCQEDKQRCCVVLQNKGTHKVGEAISAEKFVQEDDDTLLVFTDIKSIRTDICKNFSSDSNRKQKSKKYKRKNRR